MSTKAYRASGTGNAGVTGPTPRAAAQTFFDKFPTKRQCDVIEGTTDGHFFTVTFGRKSDGQWPASWKNVTKKTLNTLPAEG